MGPARPRMRETMSADFGDMAGTRGRESFSSSASRRRWASSAWRALRSAAHRSRRSTTESTESTDLRATEAEALRPSRDSLHELAARPDLRPAG